MIQRSMTIKVKIGYIRIGYKNRHNDKKGVYTNRHKNYLYSTH